jgi:hypothetical protein
MPEALLADEPEEFPRNLPLAVATNDYAAPAGAAFQAIVPLGKAFLRLSRQHEQQLP